MRKFVLIPKTVLILGGVMLVAAGALIANIAVEPHTLPDAAPAPSVTPSAAPADPVDKPTVLASSSGSSEPSPAATVKIN